MMVLESDIRPWMLEPATKKQLEFIKDIERVNDIKCTPNPTKLEASIFIDKQSKGFKDRIAKAIKEGTFVNNVTKYVSPYCSNDVYVSAAREDIDYVCWGRGYN